MEAAELGEKTENQFNENVIYIVFNTKSTKEVYSEPSGKLTETLNVLLKSIFCLHLIHVMALW